MSCSSGSGGNVIEVVEPIVAVSGSKPPLGNVASIARSTKKGLKLPCIDITVVDSFPEDENQESPGYHDNAVD